MCVCVCVCVHACVCVCVVCVCVCMCVCLCEDKVGKLGTRPVTFAYGVQPWGQVG